MTSVDAPVLRRMLRPLAAKLRDELLSELAAMKADRSEEKRYHELADKNTEGTITMEERAELESIVDANTFLSMLKLEAQATLSQRAR